MWKTKITERAHLFSLKKTAGPCRGGFTLIELMVTIAIIVIMTGAVSVGFNSFFSTVGVQNAEGYISGIIDELKMETINDEYKKSSVFFESSYLLADSVNAGADLTLSWEKVLTADGDCEAGDIRLKSSGDAELLLGSADKVFSSVQIPKDGEICVNPLEYKEREFVYNLESGHGFSNEIRIFPLNLNLRGSDNIFVKDNDYRLDILRPYGQERRYQNGTLLDENTAATITIKSTDDEAEVTFDLPKK
ncbi:MAG: prepilin-type N-terminal cleavage/methylation domain-containing protein [Patescibacteria group bacterium]